MEVNVINLFEIQPELEINLSLLEVLFAVNYVKVPRWFEEKVPMRFPRQFDKVLTLVVWIIICTLSKLIRDSRSYKYQDFIELLNKVCECLIMFLSKHVIISFVILPKHWGAFSLRRLNILLISSIIIL